ncbi:MAG: hypothetical protein KJ015_35700 [Myxococcales bacterium]|nr:hypothetical protein [Myxococcales bacterium]
MLRSRGMRAATRLLAWLMVSGVALASVACTPSGGGGSHGGASGAGGGAEGGSAGMGGSCDGSLGGASAGELALPPLTGSHLIGVQRRTLTDTSREEEATSVSGDSRRITVKFWYPSDSCSTAPRAPYTTPTEAQYYQPVSMNGAPSGWQEGIHTNSRDAPALEPGASRFPIVIMSHGFKNVREAYTSFAEQLASHGFVVAAISHAYDTEVTEFSEGDYATFAPAFGKLPPPNQTLDSHIEVWVQDAKFVLNELAKLHLNDEQGYFTGRLDLENVGIFGHSYGGATAARACIEDARFDAGMNMDGTFFGPNRENGGEKVPKPFAIFVASNHPPGDLTMKGTFSLSSPAYELTLADSGHGTFSEERFVFEHVFPSKTADTTHFGTLEPGRALEVIEAYTVAFFEQYLAGKSSTLLDGPSADFPEVEVASH